MMPLDFFNFPHLDLIKIDTQGFEREILLGARATIKKHHPTLILEAVDKKTREIEEGIQELLPDYEIKAVINRDLIAA